MPSLATRAQLCLVIGLLAAAGCAPKRVQLQRWQAADVNMPGVRRIVVAPLAGDEKWRATAQELIHKELSTHPGVQVLPLEQAAGPVSPAGEGTAHQQRLQQALIQAEQMGADALLIGEVRIGLANANNIGVAQLTIGEPITRARLHYTLLDVHTGRVRCDDRAEHTIRGEYSRGRTDFMAEEQIKKRLVGQCVDSLAEKLIARRETIDVELAAGDWSDKQLRRGNERARQGDWPGAIDAWQAALAGDGDNHAALYNLGVAHEALHEYPAARRYYQAAQDIEADRLYGNALARVETSAREHRTALLQSDVPVRLPPP